MSSNNVFAFFLSLSHHIISGGSRGGLGDLLRAIGIGRAWGGGGRAPQ